MYELTTLSEAILYILLVFVQFTMFQFGNSPWVSVQNTGHKNFMYLQK